MIYVFIAYPAEVTFDIVIKILIILGLHFNSLDFDSPLNRKFVKSKDSLNQECKKVKHLNISQDLT